tara:strand:- start:600 stop:1352 length:753 start_codon:yes stop_codon:yes gene_type:complete
MKNKIIFFSRKNDISDKKLDETTHRPKKIMHERFDTPFAVHAKNVGLANITQNIFKLLVVHGIQDGECDYSGAVYIKQMKLQFKGTKKDIDLKLPLSCERLEAFNVDNNVHLHCQNQNIQEIKFEVDPSVKNGKYSQKEGMTIPLQVRIDSDSFFEKLKTFSAPNMTVVISVATLRTFGRFNFISCNYLVVESDKDRSKHFNIFFKKINGIISLNLQNPITIYCTNRLRLERKPQPKVTMMCPYDVLSKK